jgi:P27 family predicted phage terminase small subunit
MSTSSFFPNTGSRCLRLNRSIRNVLARPCFCRLASARDRGTEPTADCPLKPKPRGEGICKTWPGTSVYPAQGFRKFSQVYDKGGMGLRGPAPKPTAIRMIEGNPGKRPFNPRGPKALDGEPEMPRHLNADARREWRRLVPILLAMRVLSESDYIALANLCQNYATLIAAQKLMAKAGGTGLLIKTSSGYIQQSPLLGIINKQIESLNKQLREFGMTPSSRTRIEAVVDPYKPGFDPLERALCGTNEARPAFQPTRWTKGSLD